MKYKVEEYIIKIGDNINRICQKGKKVYKKDISNKER